MKHWTEPNGIFIINIPAEWQYKNVVVQNGEEKSPYSFEPYENQFGCFQLSCYPLSEKGINPNLPHQKANSKLEWFEARMDDKEFDMVAVGRALLSDPEWVNKVKEGRYDEVIPFSKKHAENYY